MWRGGSLLASSPDFKAMCVTKAEYEELGSARCRRRFFHWEPKLFKVFHLLIASTFQINMCCFIEKGYRSLHVSWIAIRGQIVNLNRFSYQWREELDSTRGNCSQLSHYFYDEFCMHFDQKKGGSDLIGKLLKPDTWWICVHHNDMVKHFFLGLMVLIIIWCKG